MRFPDEIPLEEFDIFSKECEVSGYTVRPTYNLKPMGPAFLIGVIKLEHEVITNLRHDGKGPKLLLQGPTWDRVEAKYVRRKDKWTREAV